MKELIQHVVNTGNFEQIAGRSFLNCHIKGVHSFVISVEPTIRIFYADYGHEMTEGNVAYHPHHCDITLVPLVGQLTNLNATFYESFLHKGGFSKFKYASKIKSGKGSFKKIQSTKDFSRSNLHKIVLNESMFLKAEQIHSVFANPKEVCSWAVLEGREDPNYENICYSTKDLTKYSFKNLYKHCSAKDVEKYFSLLKQYASL